jgi:NRPS condensation-like uncharacterized protein
LTDKRVTVVLPKKVHRELKVYSAVNGVTMNDVMLEAVKLYLQKAAEQES